LIDRHIEELRRYLHANPDDDHSRLSLLRALERADGVKRIPVKDGDTLTKGQISAVIPIADKKPEKPKPKGDDFMVEARNLMAPVFFWSTVVFALMAVYAFGGMIVTILMPGDLFWEPFFNFFGDLTISASIILQIQAVTKQFNK